MPLPAKSGIAQPGSRAARPTSRSLTVTSSEQLAASWDFEVGRDQHHGPVRIGQAQCEDLADEGANLARREIDHSADLPPQQPIRLIMHRQLGRRLLYP